MVLPGRDRSPSVVAPTTVGIVVHQAERLPRLAYHHLVKWTQHNASLYGELEPLDRIADIRQQACPACDAAFESVTLGLHALAFADAEDLDALGDYCREVDARGGRVVIHTSRPALRRLLQASPVSAFVAAGGDEPGPGEPFTCPHR